MSRYAPPSTMHYSFGPGGMTPAVRAILALCAAGFLLTAVWPGALFLLGLAPQDVVERLRVWQFVSYLFIHQGVFHLVFNMLGIWMFGVELERRWGTQAFTKFFLVCGVVAGAATVLVGLLPIDAGWRLRTYGGVTVGASGALYGLLFAWARAFPHRTVLMFMIFPLRARWFVAVLMAIDFAVAAGSQLTSGVAHFAHFGGVAAAYFYLGAGGDSRGGGLGADLKYRYLKWKMNRLRKRFDVHPGGKDKDRWVH
ncbi:MAG: rhomboid family intramembrane serine protease [Acidobacteriota bacterium]|nr:rhomboid family intramembrane serine protease [Acidobacteriota bacterium]